MRQDTGPVQRILVIDDNESIHEDFRKILCGKTAGDSELDLAENALFGSDAPSVKSDGSFDVDFAFQGRQGYEKLLEVSAAGKPYAMSFVDMRMPPGWDGLETVERLWEVDPQLHVVICTAFADYSWEEVVERLGRSDKLLLLKKPFDNAEVWQLACALTEKWNLTRELRRELTAQQELTVELQKEVQERKAAEDRLRHNAFHDALTGLPNRAYLIERLQACIDHSKRQKEYLFGLLFLDIDNFKLINDSLGHERGDALLIEIATRLIKCVRSIDTVSRCDEQTTSRLGGDEYVVLLDGICNVSDTVLVAERILEHLVPVFKFGGHELQVTASIGIAASDHGYDKPADVLRDADTAMYRAKAAGKARHTMFDRAMHATVRARLQLENDLRRAVKMKEFELYYQPIVEISTGLLHGFEALVRWNHHGNIVMPDQFIPLAEESGLIVTIGTWVMEAACQQLKKWSVDFPREQPLQISVNVSRRQFLEGSLATEVGRILAETGVSAQHLNVEITESMIIKEGEVVSGQLKLLKELGVGVHLDDFGTGYSSLSCLHQLPIDVVKIDRAFTATMDSNPYCLGIIQAITSLVHGLGMRVIIEGIEMPDQLNRIVALMCDFGQGHIFSKPFTAKAAEQFIVNVGTPLFDLPVSRPPN
jgi:diguanylate cyclase (GGDEF)-like protein